LESLFEHYDQITASGYSVSAFHRFGEQIDQVWVKRRTSRPGGDEEEDAAGDLFGAPPASAPRNPVLGADPVNYTPQLGVPGPWSERLPHFRSGFLPSSGEEIQSEFFVARDDAPAAFAAMQPLAASIQPLLLVSELRTVAADTLWLSPQFRRPSAGIHFTWRRRQSEVEQLMSEIEARLARSPPGPTGPRYSRAERRSSPGTTSDWTTSWPCVTSSIRAGHSAMAGCKAG
jgi:xylitol oxidase